MAYGKAYRDISLLYESSKTAVRAGDKDAIPVRDRLKGYHKKRADAIKAAKKAQKAAEEKAKADKLALEEAIKNAQSGTAES